VESIRKSENVVGRLPVGVLVGGPEPRQPERRRIGEGTGEVGRSSARPDRRLKGIHDGHGVIPEKRPSERRVI
jgi:hypothetical protein